MPHTHNELNAADQDCLAQLTATAQREHLAVGCALGNALAHAMAAGDALLAARELVPPGSWQAHLRKHDISERSARVYIQVAKARAVLERQSSAGPLSIAAALAYLKDPGAAEKKPAAKSRHKATSFDALGWWGGLTREEREHFLGHFLEDAGLTETLAAMPSAMRTELMRRARRANGYGHGKPKHNGETLAEHIARSSLAERIEAARTVGVDTVWDSMIAPVIATERAAPAE
jgi:hypothetical protein